jgi:hypothetical protein
MSLEAIGSGVLGGVSGGAGGAIAGGGKKGGADPMPDYKGAAEATGRENRPNQYTPFASTQWTTGPDGRPVQTTGLAPGMQGAMTGMQGQLSSAWGTPLDTGAQARDRAENAIYGREASRLDPMWQQREQGMNASLANQGLDPGSAAAQATRDQFGRARNDAYQQAQYGAITGGGQEASRQQAMDLQSRMAPLQGMAGLRSLMQMPGFQPGANYLAAAGMQGQYQLGSKELQNQAMADYWNGITGMAKGAAAFAA